MPINELIKPPAVQGANNFSSLIALVVTGLNIVIIAVALWGLTICFAEIILFCEFCLSLWVLKREVKVK